MPLQHGDGGMGNNSITLEQGLWSFLVKVDPTQTSGEVGSVIIQECSASKVFPSGQGLARQPGLNSRLAKGGITPRE